MVRLWMVTTLVVGIGHGQGVLGWLSSEPSSDDISWFSSPGKTSFSSWSNLTPSSLTRTTTAASYVPHSVDVALVSTSAEYVEHLFQGKNGRNFAYENLHDFVTMIPGAYDTFLKIRSILEYPVYDTLATCFAYHCGSFIARCGLVADSFQDFALFLGGHTVLYYLFMSFSFPYTEKRNRNDNYYFIVNYLSLFLLLTSVLYMPKIRALDLFRSFGMRDILVFSFAATPFSALTIIGGDIMFGVFNEIWVYFYKVPVIKEIADEVDNVIQHTEEDTRTNLISQEPDGMGDNDGMMGDNDGTGGSSLTRTRKNSEEDQSSPDETDGSEFNPRGDGNSVPSSAPNLAGLSGSKLSLPNKILNRTSMPILRKDSSETIIADRARNMNKKARLRADGVLSQTVRKTARGVDYFFRKDPKWGNRRGLDENFSDNLEKTLDTASVLTKPDAATTLLRRGSRYHPPPGHRGRDYSRVASVPASMIHMPDALDFEPRGSSDDEATPSERPDDDDDIDDVDLPKDSPDVRRMNVPYGVHRTKREFVSNATLLTCIVTVQYWYCIFTAEVGTQSFLSYFYGPDSMICTNMTNPWTLQLNMIGTFALALAVGQTVEYLTGRKVLLSYGPKWDSPVEAKFLDPTLVKDMVPWYDMYTTKTACDEAITGNLFVKRFDIRQMFTALKGPPKVFSFIRDFTRFNSMGTGGPNGEDQREFIQKLEAATNGLSIDSKNGNLLQTPDLPKRSSSAVTFSPQVGPAPSSPQVLPTSHTIDATTIEGKPPLTSIFGSADSLEQRCVSAQSHITPRLKKSGGGESSEVWVDFVADTGDGFDAQYAIARAQAQPRLRVRLPAEKDAENGSATSFRLNVSGKQHHGGEDWIRNLLQMGDNVAGQLLNCFAKRKSNARDFISLPRAKYYFHGGDIAYPSPNRMVFLERFFLPYHLALREPKEAATVIAHSLGEDLSGAMSQSAGSQFRSFSDKSVSSNTRSSDSPIAEDGTTVNLSTGKAADKFVASPPLRSNSSFPGRVLLSKSMSNLNFFKGRPKSDTNLHSVDPKNSTSSGISEFGEFLTNTTYRKNNNPIATRSQIQCPNEKMRAKELKDHQGPLCFIIPGNHDWFDNLETFQELICQRSWLGGWYMPQEHSYFITQVTTDWYVFGLDISLTNDIDATQFLYFKWFVEQELIPGRSRVIAITHRPNWCCDVYDRARTGPWLMQLLHSVMKDVLAMRMAGDLHHYARYEATVSTEYAIRDGLSQEIDPQKAVPLIIAGGGGAFTHGAPWGGMDMMTTEYESFENEPRKPYEGYVPVVCYPTEKTTKSMAKTLPTVWRQANYQADIVLGGIYLLGSLGIFPCCFIELSDLQKQKTWLDLLGYFFVLFWRTYLHMMENTYLAFFAHLFIFYITWLSSSNQEYSKTRHWKNWIAFVHGLVHSLTIIFWVIVLELCIEFARQYHKPQRLKPAFVQHMDENWFGDLGVMSYLVRKIVSSIELPEHIGEVKTALCAAQGPTTRLFGGGSYFHSLRGAANAPAVSRLEYLTYKFEIAIYFYAAAIPCAAYIMGSFFFLAIYYFGLHANESFVGLRDPNHKSFVRMRIDKKQNLKAWVIGFDDVGSNSGAHWKHDTLSRSRMSDPWNDPVPSKFSSRKVTPPVLVDSFSIYSNSKS